MLCCHSGSENPHKMEAVALWSSSFVSVSLSYASLTFLEGTYLERIRNRTQGQKLKRDWKPAGHWAKNRGQWLHRGLCAYAEEESHPVVPRLGPRLSAVRLAIHKQSDHNFRMTFGASHAPLCRKRGPCKGRGHTRAFTSLDEKQLNSNLLSSCSWGCYIAGCFLWASWDRQLVSDCKKDVFLLTFHTQECIFLQTQEN